MRPKITRLNRNTDQRLRNRRDPENEGSLLCPTFNRPLRPGELVQTFYSVSEESELYGIKLVCKKCFKLLYDKDRMLFQQAARVQCEKCEKLIEIAAGEQNYMISQTATLRNPETGEEREMLDVIVKCCCGQCAQRVRENLTAQGDIVENH
jgi:hypothetical protein